MAGRSWWRGRRSSSGRLLYELLAVWLIALPFLLLWLATYRRPLPSPALAARALGADRADGGEPAGHRLRPRALPLPRPAARAQFPRRLCRSDDDGATACSSTCSAATGAGRSSRRCSAWRRRGSISGGRSGWRGAGSGARPAVRLGRWPALAILALPLAAGLIAYLLAQARFRLSRLEPAAFAIVRDFAWRYEDETPPGDMAALAPRLAGGVAGGERRPGLALPGRRLSLSPRARRARAAGGAGPLERAHHPAGIGAGARDRPSDAGPDGPRRRPIWTASRRGPTRRSGPGRSPSARPASTAASRCNAR